MNDISLKDKSDDEIISVINFLPTQAIWMDASLKIKSANHLFLTLVNKTLENVIGTSINDYPFQNLHQYFVHIDLLRNRDLTIIDYFEVNNIKKSVRFFIQEVAEKNSFFVVGIDLSKDHFRQEAHEESRVQQEEDARFTLIGQMSAGVAHEINNPLAIISGFLFNMKRDLEKKSEAFDTELFIDRISRSMKSVDRIAMIVRGLKFLTKNDLHSPYEKIQVQDLVNSVLDLCIEKFKVSNIRLIVDEISPQMIINCRPIQIAQVMLNLLLNSHDAIEESDTKWIRISFPFSEETMTISITDSGLGIPIEIRHKIMQPFSTTKSVKKGAGIGVGIGLSRLKMILQDHGAELVYDHTSTNTKFDLIFKRN